MNDVLAEIAVERERQVAVEGWTPEHDYKHASGALAQAAGCYADHAGSAERWRRAQGNLLPYRWPWTRSWWKPSTREEDRQRARAFPRAALETMREPTLAMIALGAEAEDAGDEPVGEIGAGAVWSAMVEEALR